jgi:hypothetical protein
MAAKKPLALSSGFLQQFQTGDFLDVVHGGTGAITASGARSALGLVIGSDIQAYDPDLAAIAAFSSTGIAVRTASDTWAQRTIVGTSGRIVVNDGSGASGNPTIDLDTLADGGSGSFLKITRDTYGRVSGSAAVVEADISALVDSRYLQLTGGTLTGALTLAGDPTQALHAVTKQYADGLSQGLDTKASVRVATTGNISLNGGGTVDGITLVNGDRILVKDQSSPEENGIYIVGAGAWSRAEDMDAWSEVPSAYVWVELGTVNADSGWVCTSDQGGTLEVTAITWTLFASAGSLVAGAGLTKTGNQIDVITADSGRIVVNADNIDLASGIVTPGTYTKVTVDTYGRVTVGDTATPADIGAQASDADLTAIAALSGTGFAVRTGADAWAQRSITVAGGGSSRITVTNGDGVSGNPELDLRSGIATPGTYGSVTVDTYGRVTSGTPGGGGAAITSTLTNNEAGTVVIGSAVYNDAAGGFKKAVANADGTSKAIGVAGANINSSASGEIVTAGEVSATTGEWDAVTGQSGGLTFGAVYYMDNTTAGNLTTTAPGSGYVAPLGLAVSATKLVVRVGPRVQL